MNKEIQKKFVDDAQYEWGKGTVQRKQFDEARIELLEMADTPFARTIDEPKLERQKKELMRDGDPMAEYFQTKKSRTEKSIVPQNATTAKKSIPSKQKYSGPKPPPNRFSIIPGYRWDAVDRGNGLEKKILLKISERSAFDEDKYKWSVSDM